MDKVLLSDEIDEIRHKYIFEYDMCKAIARAQLQAVIDDLRERADGWHVTDPENAHPYDVIANEARRDLLRVIADAYEKQLKEI